ncbi:hypothetical protein DER45DRAFT_185002 [Fusarium avenaceum]|nr:hypothetical protein DER45DRAFT_185002 [Fusarium avenaceum]
MQETARLFLPLVLSRLGLTRLDCDWVQSTAAQPRSQSLRSAPLSSFWFSTFCSSAEPKGNLKNQKFGEKSSRRQLIQRKAFLEQALPLPRPQNIGRIFTTKVMGIGLFIVLFSNLHSSIKSLHLVP